MTNTLATGFEFNYIDIENIKSYDEISLKKIFNSVEDVCYIYKSKFDELSEETKEGLEAYLIRISKWTNENKERIGSFEHKYYHVFKTIQTDLTKIDDLVAQVITPIHDNTLYNWLDWFKSSDAFYSVQGNHKINQIEEVSEIVDLAIKNANKSIKTEKIGSYHLYVVSGKASEDYKENADGAYYKKAAEKAVNKEDLDLIAPAGSYDGMVIQKNEEKLILFATSKNNTKKQNVFNVLKKEPNGQIIFVSTPIFNQKYSYVNTDYAGRKAEQHGTAFLKQFGEDFTFNELGDLNLLPFMSLIDNVEIPDTGDSPLKISDLLRLNPFVYGTDTYSTYKAFRDIEIYPEPEKTEKLQTYYIDYTERLLNKLLKIENNYHLNTDTESIISNIQRVLLGTMKNFNSSNLPNGLPNQQNLEKLTNCIVSYNKITEKMDAESKINNSVSNMFLKEIEDQDDLLNFLKKRNKKLNSPLPSLLPITKEKVALYDHIENKYADFLYDDLNMPVKKVEHILEIIKIRQLNPKHSTFTPEALSTNTYLFFNLHKSEKNYDTIFSFIENNFDYNDPIVFDTFCEQLKINKVQYQESVPKEKMLDAVWDKLTDGSYQLNNRFLEFLELIKSKGEEGLSIYEAQKTSFHKTNIEYKESQNSYFKNSNGAKKTEAHNQLMKIIGLYDFKGANIKNFTYANVEKKLSDYLELENKNKKNIKL